MPSGSSSSSPRPPTAYLGAEPPASSETPPVVPASILARVFLQEDINFLVTNRIPRRYATLAMGWLSRVESPALTRAAIAAWRLFADDLDLHEAKTSTFNSLHECFIRELKQGARPVDPDPLVTVSPCDALVGATGKIQGTEVFQAKGFPYSLMDLLGDPALAEKHRDGWFVTLRLKSNMYHRFHAPHDGHVSRVTYVSGDTWNVNPIALKRVEKLFCKNERAIIDLELEEPGLSLTMVPIAAILVAGIRLHFLDHTLDLKYKGPNILPCDATLRKGDEIGYFHAGSTIVLFASGTFVPCDNVVTGAKIRAGQPLFRRPARPPTTAVLDALTHGDD